MGFSAGTTSISTTVRLTGAVPAPGNAPANTLSDPSTTVTATATQDLTYGTGEGETHVQCAGEFIIAAGASLTLNLYDGGTTTADLVRLVTGAAAALRRVRSLTFAVVSGGSSSGVSVGGAASNEFIGFFGAAGDTVTIFPDGPALPLGSPAGVTVTSSAKNVKLENLSSTAAVVVRVTASGGEVESGYATGLVGMPTYA